MSVYRLMIPVFSNTRERYSHSDFLFAVAKIAGGYTLEAEAEGVWLDGSRLYRDTVRPLLVCTGLTQWKQIMERFWAAFPDQKCAMFTIGGNVDFAGRPG
jgi:hypothetical protein